MVKQDSIISFLGIGEELLVKRIIQLPYKLKVARQSKSTK
jgi:hypothetical protein